MIEPLLRGAREVLEVASGSGQHAAFFAERMPHLRWQSSEQDSAQFASIAAWAEESGVAAPLPPVRLDATADDWSVGRFDAVFCANMIHIAPWQACLGLLRGASRHLLPDGLLLLYGPFREGGAHTAPSNAAFDESLRARDPRWSVRDLEAIEAAALEQALALQECVTMPANNRILVFRRDGGVVLG